MFQGSVGIFLRVFHAIKNDQHLGWERNPETRTKSLVSNESASRDPRSPGNV